MVPVVLFHAISLQQRVCWTENSGSVLRGGRISSNLRVGAVYCNVATPETVAGRSSCARRTLRQGKRSYCDNPCGDRPLDV